MNDLDQSVTELAALRESARLAKEMLKKMDEWYEASPERVLAKIGADTTASAVAALEGTIRQDALLVFAQNGSKHPHLAVEIKVVKAVKYVEEAARNWCEKNLPGCLALDKKKFEHAALNGFIHQDIITIEETPKAYIKTDLSAAATDG